MTLIRRLFILLSLLAAGLIAGLFYAFSISVMPGLDTIDPTAAINAMQAVNVVIVSAIFGVVIFGAVAYPVIAALLCRRRSVVVPLILAALVYGVGGLGITMVFNVPLNDALAAAGPTPADPAAVWAGYSEPWTAWNHLRTGACMLALLLVGWAVAAEWRQPAAG